MLATLQSFNWYTFEPDSGDAGQPVTQDEDGVVVAYTAEHKKILNVNSPSRLRLFSGRHRNAAGGACCIVYRVGPRRGAGTPIDTDRQRVHTPSPVNLSYR